MKTKKSGKDKNDLLANMERYGYSLMRPAVSTAPSEEVLRDLVEQDDARLLEGFPVVLAHALKEKKLVWENPSWQPPAEFSKQAERRLAVLLVLTYLLLRLYGHAEEETPRVLNLAFRCRKGKDLLPELSEAFFKGLPVKLDRLELSPERLKNNFRNYVVHAAESDEVRKKQRTLELELLLSQLFTPRQKELVRKRLQGKAMTKTEREYYYRVVKKRLKVLANEELHQMARQVLAA